MCFPIYLSQSFWTTLSFGLSLSIFMPVFHKVISQEGVLKVNLNQNYLWSRHGISMATRSNLPSLVNTIVGLRPSQPIREMSERWVQDGDICSILYLVRWYSKHWLLNLWLIPCHKVWGWGLEAVSSQSLSDRLLVKDRHNNYSSTLVLRPSPQSLVPPGPIPHTPGVSAAWEPHIHSEVFITHAASTLGEHSSAAEHCPGWVSPPPRSHQLSVVTLDEGIHSGRDGQGSQAIRNNPSLTW